MIRRLSMTLGLLAFAITIMGGLVVGNSFDFILGKALWSLAIFAFIGAGVGYASQHVVREHRRRQHEQIYGPSEGDSTAQPSPDDPENNSEPEIAQPMKN